MEVEESWPLVGVVVVVCWVVAGLGLDPLVDRGRGVARVDGPGSPPAPPPAAALVLVLVLLLVEVVELAVLVVVPLVPLPLLQVCWEAAACMALARACSSSLAFFLSFSFSSFLLLSPALPASCFFLQLLSPSRSTHRKPEN